MRVRKKKTRLRKGRCMFTEGMRLRKGRYAFKTVHGAFFSEGSGVQRGGAGRQGGRPGRGRGIFTGKIVNYL